MTNAYDLYIEFVLFFGFCIVVSVNLIFLPIVWIPIDVPFFVMKSRDNTIL